MFTFSKEFILNAFSEHKEEQLFGRWITLNHIQKTFSRYGTSSKIQMEQIGSSEEGRDIFQFSMGSGKKRILIWSQMHGNESTGTKSVFDLLNYVDKVNHPSVDRILSECTIKIIPILNPDGAERYTRVNANNVDLNRDAVDREAKESRLLRSILEDFNPDFSFNLHDQRTIFGVEGTNNPATISFLAPSEEETRKITKGRAQTMNVIIAMNTLLQQLIPNCVGRYTDEFYPKATGDNFQKLGYNTVLIESGHYPDDYEREESRKYTFISLLQGIHHIANTVDFNESEAYFTIPDNQENFRDLLHADKKEAFQYEEILENGKINFVPRKIKEDISSLLFHKKTFS
tara:strand:+ start:37320 stop:38354 length:1035 start_codon:yes stop_codon:yes gene_type:complete